VLVGFFPARAAFPVLEAGRHPRFYFRGLLKLHSHYGLQGCSPTLLWALSRGFTLTGFPIRALASYRIQPTTIRMGPSPTGNPRLWGALQKLEHGEKIERVVGSVASKELNVCRTGRQPDGSDFSSSRIAVGIVPRVLHSNRPYQISGETREGSRPATLSSSAPVLLLRYSSRRTVVIVQHAAQSLSPLNGSRPVGL
jgi:hypothetical protein